MIEYSERLKSAMEGAKIGVTELAKDLGVSYQAVKRATEGKSKAFSAANNEKAARRLGVSSRWLATGEGAREGPAEFDRNVGPTATGSRPYPVISYIQAGLLTEIQAPYPPEAGFDVEYGDSDASPWAFFLEIDGDSMLPDFKSGDRVLIDPDVVPRPGDFVAARNTKEEATFKKYRVRGIDAGGNEIFDLVPLNDNYPTLHSDQIFLRIIGTMTEHRRKYRRK